MKKSKWLAVAVMIMTVWAAAANAQEAAPITLDNLRTALASETNAKAQALAFAAKADEEGFPQVASLFRACAQSKAVNLKRYAKLIQKLKGGPKAENAPPVVKSTTENLKIAQLSAIHEKDRLFPQFVKAAEAEKFPEAVRAFHGAIAAKTEHVKYFQEALDKLDQWKQGPKEFLVCTVCGYTTTDLALTQCPICSTPREKFDLVK